jgi:hypothetical protein
MNDVEASQSNFRLGKEEYYDKTIIEDNLKLD